MAVWHIKSADPDLVSRLKDQVQLPEILTRILVNRGIQSVHDLAELFAPELTKLNDPFQMLNMDRASEQVARTVREGKRILVFGDYDVDGITAASMLYLFLSALGVDVSVYIPDREKEGYGLSRRGIDFAVEKGVHLVITCDCGINAHEAVSYANGKGIPVIITDHHTPDVTLPDALAVLNPKQTGCEYPFKHLCGGGVAFKLVSAVAQRLDIPFENVSQHLDLVALGTAADLVPLVDENRVLVYHGLKQLERSDKPGIQALLRKAGVSGAELTVGKLIYWVAPRINAAGRMGDAIRAVTLLTTTDRDQAQTLALQLHNENRSRQVIQQNIVQEVEEKIKREVDLDRDRAMVLWKEGWHPGVIGIVASKVKEAYHRPVVVVSVEGETGKGSARSIRPFDLYEHLSRCARHLTDYGGHPMAAGLTIDSRNLEAFRDEFVALANDSLSRDDMVNALDIEGEMDLNVIDDEFVDFLKKLAPYGPGNSRPRFVTRKTGVLGTPRLVGNGDHLKFTARKNGSSFDAIGFNMARHYEHLITGEPVDIAYEVEENRWKGQVSIQLNIKDVKPAGGERS
ncbi:MAG: single-stranded-DNA-specific exonuclease RecJ [Fidelibacterota bacterium]